MGLKMWVLGLLYSCYRRIEGEGKCERMRVKEGSEVVFHAKLNPED